MKIEQLLGMSFEQFNDEYRNKKYHIVKNNDGRFKDYFSWKETDEYLNSYGLSDHDRMPQLQIIDYETGKKYCHKKAELKLQKKDIYKKWKNGSTFVLSLCEFLNKKLWTQCKDFEEYYGRGQANIYMSSKKDARCFPTHADTTENFLFHVRGTTRWYIMNEYEKDCKPNEATLDKVVDLSEGDLLWLSPKLYHRVVTLGPRISISFHFHPPEKQGIFWREEWLDWIGDINGSTK